MNLRAILVAFGVQVESDSREIDAEYLQAGFYPHVSGRGINNLFVPGTGVEEEQASKSGGANSFRQFTKRQSGRLDVHSEKTMGIRRGHEAKGREDEKINLIR